MRFRNCSLQLPHRASREFIFEVAHVDFRSDGQTNQFKLGGEFIQAPVELIKDVSSYAQETQGGFIQDVTEGDFDLLWEFMFETNFIYQDKRKQIQNKSREILETYHRLLSTDNPIVKKIVFKEGSEIKGHVSAVRFYDNAWIIQHLNALKANGGSAAREVITAIVNFFFDAKAMNKSETYYVMSFYRPDNIYPAIIFGETSRRINDPQKSIAFDLSFGTYEPKEDRFFPEINVLIDDPETHFALADHLVEKDMAPFMRAIGIGSSTELKIADSFQSLGLLRERHLLDASESDCRVFALAELSSPGLNLSELTNSVFLFTEGQNEELIAKLSDAVLDKAYNLYYRPRGISPVVLQRPDSVRSAMVLWSKVYTCWLTSAKAVVDFEKHSKTVIQDFRELALAFKRSFSDEISKKESKSA